MRPGIVPGQVVSLLAILFRRPILTARCNLRLLGRGLVYLADNPDLAWARHLITGGRPAAPGALVLIRDKGKIVFSFVASGKSAGNLPNPVLRSIDDLDSFREKIEDELDRPLQLIQVDATLIDRIRTRVVENKDLDSFFAAGREIVEGLSRGDIVFSPVILEAEVGASLDGEELLAKFGPRFGLGVSNPVRLSSLLRGLGLLVTSPLRRRRMRRAIAAYND